MSGFSIRNPYFIVVVCLIISVVGMFKHFLGASDYPPPISGHSPYIPNKSDTTPRSRSNIVVNLRP